MPSTTPTQFRLTDQERARLDELGKIWGDPGRPLPWAEVFRRLIWESRECDVPLPKRKRAKP